MKINVSAPPFSSGTLIALSIVERARRYLATLPPSISGSGGHDAAFRAASCLTHGFSLDEATAYALMASEFNPRCQPPWSPAELAHKVRSSMGAPADKPRGHLIGELADIPATLPGSSPKWPETNMEEIHRITAAGPTALELWKRSPELLDVDDGSNGADILLGLFGDGTPKGPLLCIGKSNAEFATRPLSTWVSKDNLDGGALVVPSPMSARIGHTKDGRESEHTLENTGPRRFLVVEFDKGTADDHAARLWHLAEYGSLVLVVHSGGKSLHGWFYCAGQPEAALRKFMAYAVSIGADKATWTKSQFVRLPAGQRENGVRQSVFYFDPAAINRGEATL